MILKFLNKAKAKWDGYGSGTKLMHSSDGKHVRFLASKKHFPRIASWGSGLLPCSRPRSPCAPTHLGLTQPTCPSNLDINSGAFSFTSRQLSPVLAVASSSARFDSQQETSKLSPGRLHSHQQPQIDTVTPTASERPDLCSHLSAFFIIFAAAEYSS